VGKIGIPDSILLKPKDLTPEEWEIMRGHTLIGAEILRDSPSEILQVGSRIAMSHHEKWNGDGYPGGIAGEEIPLEGRICAVVDVFDALTSNRRYRPRGAIPNPEAYEMMAEERGRYFDPAVLDVFMDKREAIEGIQGAFRETPARNLDPR